MDVDMKGFYDRQDKERIEQAKKNDLKTISAVGDGYTGYLTGQENNTQDPILSEGAQKPSTEGSTTPAITQTYEAWLSSMEKNKQNAYGKAEMDYDKAVLDAEQRYQKSLSNYGATKEQLMDAGLANSGYAKYLDDRAYATRSSEILAAQAGKTEAEKAADIAYNDEYTQYLLSRIEKEEETKKAIQDNISYGGTWYDTLSAINSAETSGALSPKAIAQQYSSLFEDIRIQAGTDEVFTKEDGERMSETEAKGYLAKLKSAGLDETTKKTLESTLSRLYDVTVLSGVELDAGELTEGNKRLPVKYKGKKYVMNRKEETTDKAVMEAARKAATETSDSLAFFKLGNALYVYDKANGKAYSLEQRGNRDGYNDFIAIFNSASA